MALTDTHAGHKLGLCNPATKLQEEDQTGRIVEKPVELSTFQEWLWHEFFLPTLKDIERITRGDDIAVLHNGDMTHGNGHPDELMSTRMENQIRIGVANMRPLMDLPGVRAMRAAYGTGVHEFGEGSGALLITDMLKALYPRIDSQVLYHGLADVDGVGVDYAHHGPGTGSRQWLRGNVSQLYLRSAMMTEVMHFGNVPPQLYLRGHVHDYANVVQMIEAWGGEVWSRMIVLPSLCGLGDYGRKATRSQFALQVAIVLCVIESGKVVDVVPFRSVLDLRTKEKII